MKGPIPTFTYLVKRLAEDFSDLAFLSVIEPGVHGYLDGDHLGKEDVRPFNHELRRRPLH